ncbi:16148_t:CDS:2 [Acaulospora colombiana]|uniref:16148_t:CDS:1 n=1 Tax=Acaulospora colombiana TaxID=27376 RepID=A0ACA9LPG0_9GLOM|nr:16148_t:CDS:2 [Acaulospora colombiana]
MKKLIKLFDECEALTEKTMHRTLYLIEAERGIGSGFPRNIYFIQSEAMKYTSDVAQFIRAQENLQSFQCIYLSPTPDVIDSLGLRANSLRYLDFICSNFLECGPLIGEPLFTTTFPRIKDVTVIGTDCPELRSWALNLMTKLYPDHATHDKCKGNALDVDMFDVINNDFKDSIQFDLNHVREMMLHGLECQVCLKLCIYPVTTPCGHTFCDECITNFMKHNDVCPLITCRNNLQGSDKNYFYSHPVDSQDYIKYEKRRKFAEIMLYEEMSILVVQSEVSYELGESYVIPVKYNKMIKKCLESYHRKFGVALKCPEKIYHDGGTIMEVVNAIPGIDRSLELTVIAKDRFRVLERKRKDDYDVAKVELVTESPGEVDVVRNNTSNFETNE